MSEFEFSVYALAILFTLYLQSLYLTIVVKTVSFTKKDLQLTGTNFQKYGRHSLMIALFAHRGEKRPFRFPHQPNVDMVGCNLAMFSPHSSSVCISTCGGICCLVHFCCSGWSLDLLPIWSTFRSGTGHISLNPIGMCKPWCVFSS